MNLKIGTVKQCRFQILIKLLSSSYLTGTQATGAGVDSARRAVNYSLYSHNVRFPRSVWTSVRVRYLYTKGYAFSANFTFSHLSAPPFKLTVHITGLYYQIWTQIASLFLKIFLDIPKCVFWAQIRHKFIAFNHDLYYN